MVVAHGRVMSLFVARRNALDPYDLWERLGLPSFVVLDLPNYGIVEVTDRLYEDATGADRKLRACRRCSSRWPREWGRASRRKIALRLDVPKDGTAHAGLRNSIVPTDAR